MQDPGVPEREGEVVAIYNLEGTRKYSMLVHPCVPSYARINLGSTRIIFHVLGHAATQSTFEKR